MAPPLVFPLPGNQVFAERLAVAVDGEIGELAMRDFPDGETYVRLESDPTGREVVVVATLRHPNEQVLPLLFVADAARQMGAARVGLVAPYLAYMRQDAQFHPGEAVTARSFAAFLSRTVDWLITVDPHLHRVAKLDDVYSIAATAIHVAAEMGAWIAANVASPILVGPDEESRQWVSNVAAAAKAPYLVLAKARRGDTDVSISEPDQRAVADHTPVLVDDIISTGQTMISAARQLAGDGGRPPVCVAVHAVFSLGAYLALEASGVAKIATTNTIAHPSNAIDVVPALAGPVREQLARAAR